jgi:hypothetical protein
LAIADVRTDMNSRVLAFLAIPMLLLTACAGDEATAPTEVPDLPAPTSGVGAIGTIEVTITHPDADDVVYTIGCTGDAFPVTPPVDGVDGPTACSTLADPSVVDRLVEGRSEDQMCTEIYGGPDVATITGEIDGRAIDATIDRSDGCGIDEWDTLLAGVLPPALGVTG